MSWLRALACLMRGVSYVLVFAAGSTIGADPLAAGVAPLWMVLGAVASAAVARMAQWEVDTRDARGEVIQYLRADIAALRAEIARKRAERDRGRVA